MWRDCRTEEDCINVKRLQNWRRLHQCEEIVELKKTASMRRDCRTEEDCINVKRLQSWRRLHQCEEIAELKKTASMWRVCRTEEDCSMVQLELCLLQRALISTSYIWHVCTNWKTSKPNLHSLDSVSINMHVHLTLGLEWNSEQFIIQMSYFVSCQRSSSTYC